MSKRLLILRFPYESASGMGGEENHILGLARALQKKGHFVTLSTSCKCLVEHFEKQQISVQKVWGGIDVVSKKAILLFPFIGPFACMNLWFHLLSQKRKNKIDTIYCLTLIEKILVTPFARILGMQVIWGQHTKPEKWFQKNPLIFLYKLWSRFVKIVVPSKDMQKAFVKCGIQKKRIHVIPNGLDTENISRIKDLKKKEFEKKLLQTISQKKFQAKKTPTFEVKKYTPKRFRKANPYVIGVVSRLSPEKGLENLLDAASKLIKIRPECVFCIIGDGKEKENIEFLIEQKGLSCNVFLLGYKNYEYISYFLSSIDVFVLPSPYESFGIAALEAMYFGAPVVASRAGGLKDFIQQRETGLLFTAGDTTDLAKTIEYVILHPEKAKIMAENAKKMVFNMYLMDKIVERWIELFEKK